jgi:protein-tyrosine phosphatase
MTYSEIHFHLLPGVDDGPSSIDESLELATLAVRDGTGTVIATPHVHRQHITEPLEIADRVRELAVQLRRKRIPLAVLPGGELAHDMVARLSQRELETIAQGPAGRRWLLLEAPFDGLDGRYTRVADELRDRGFGIVVAHPERAAQTAGTERAIEHELAHGSRFQLTAGSFAGLHGEQPRSLARRLLRRASGSVIASDAHGRGRPPSLQPALDALRGAGVPDPARFADTRPRALLQEGIALVPVARAASRRWPLAA